MLADAVRTTLADAVQCLGLGRMDLAEDICVRLMRQAPAAEPMVLMAGLRRLAGRPDQAAVLLGRAAALLGSTAAAEARLAELLRRAGNVSAYQQRIERLRDSPYLDYPAHVHLETLAVCNADCVFCPSSTMARKGTRMPDDLMAKIIDDLTGIPASLPFQLSPLKVNEPLLDHRLYGLLDLIGCKLPNAEITLTSNGSPLTERHIERLAAVPALKSLWISLNDHRPEHYQVAMGLPFERTVARLAALHRRKEQGGFAVPVTLSRVGDGSPADGAFAAWVAERFPLFAAAVVGRGDWLGQVAAGSGAVPLVGCNRWFDLSITATGVVAHCCMDGHAAHPIGDVRRSSVLEIYNSPAYRSLRQHTVSRLEADPCRTCCYL